MVENAMIDDALARNLGHGKRVVLHSGVCEPIHLAQHIADRAPCWPGLTVETLMSPGPCPYVDVDGIIVDTLVPWAAMRGLINGNGVNPIRSSLFNHALACDKGEWRANVLMLQVTEPDSQGQVSLGPCVSYMPQILNSDATVIAAINRELPVTGYRIPVSRLNYVFEHSAKLPVTELAPGNEVDQKIADNVLSLLRDDITVEIGIGSTPDAIMRSLCGLKEIQIHTGMLNQAVLTPLKSGSVVGKIVTAMAMGNVEFFHWLDGNDQVDLQPIMKTHSPVEIAGKPNFFAVNGALQVDLAGNVNVEKVAGRRISCPGGLPDFSRAAQMSPGGASIIALRSTAGRQSLSTIVPKLDHKTLDGSYVDWVVTEHGAARLKGKSVAERKAAMLAITHPDHRN